MGNIVTDLLGAYFRSTGLNETTLVSTRDDPPKHRFGVKWLPGWGRSLGCLSFNKVRQDEVEDEVVLIQGKMDDRYSPENMAGELRLDLKRPSISNTDGDMVGVFNMYHDKVEFHVPVSVPNLQSGVLASPDNRYRAQLQNDGNLVVIEVASGQPIWSWMTGVIAAPPTQLPLPLPTPTPGPTMQCGCSYSRGPYIFVDAHEGNDTDAGDSWGTSLKTMAEAFKRLRRGAVIHVFGKITEEGLVTPHGCTGVTILGCLNRPSGRVSGEGPKAGGAWWARKDDNADVPLLRVTQQGWRFEHIGFIPNRTGGGLLFTRNQAAEDVTTSDAEAGDHADIVDCRFYGPAPFAILQEGGVVAVRIEDCLFQQFGKPDQWALLGRTGAGIGWPLFWQIKNNRFIANHGDINIDGLSDSVIMDNTFHRRSILGSFPDKPSIVLGSGTDNVVTNNHYAA